MQHNGQGCPKPFSPLSPDTACRGAEGRVCNRDFGKRASTCQRAPLSLARYPRRRDRGITMLTHNELLQMAGRAGRRGFDTQGAEYPHMSQNKE